MTSLVVTLVGPDRPGIVEAVSGQAVAHGANWAESLMANLAGQFAGILHLHVPEANAAGLEKALQTLAGPGMQVTVTRAGTVPDQKGRRMSLSLIGHDRPGIIQAISAALARQGVSIATLETAIVSGAMSGEQLFDMQAELDVPASVSPDQIRHGLESLATDLMVDLEFDRPKQ
jgi:glycine cleavage system regulatory protein